VAERRDPVLLHVDMDAFFASVEILDAPSLRGLPVVVGGSGSRGVVASCSYEARAFGVRSAMPMQRARQLCPSIVVLDGRYARYEEVSRELRAIFGAVTPLVEPIGLDEAFLDVTGALQLFGGPEDIAAGIRRRVETELSLECSIGIGRSKLIAKLASRAAKPSAGLQGTRVGLGILAIPAHEELAFLHPMPVGALWGVGPATAERLHSLGIQSVGDLARTPRSVLERRFGRAQGGHLADLSVGYDPSPVVPDRPAKSIGHEETFARDIDDPDDVRHRAGVMAEVVATQLRAHELTGRTVSVKVRFGDFTLVTRSHTVARPIDTAPALQAVCNALLESLDVTPGIRLLGVSVSGLAEAGGSEQLAFDLDASEGLGDRASRLQTQWQGVTTALDEIRERFGAASVGSAAAVGPDGLEVRERRRAAWGPADPTSPD
jgi:DNA polymerase-4